MSATAAALDALDASALQWLDRLLQEAPRDRAETLERLSVQAPTVHARVLRLLASIESSEASMVLQQPLAGLSGDLAQTPVALEAGATLGGYRLLRPIGRGGMSVVWLAERIDGLIKRPVALKMPLWLCETAADRERFSRERDVLASLAHPGIARLLDAGVAASGQPFLVLEFVDGVPLTQACNDAGMPLPARVRLFLTVLQAVDHAHRHLVVHRDLKPSNILVDTEGRARLLDFGIAKLMDDAASSSDRTSLTQAAGCALTPRYAAPEQLENGHISTATDVYALGVVLYELLCGVSPYGDAPRSTAQWMRAVLETAPQPPSRALRDVPGVRRAEASAVRGDLENVLLKALDKSPAGRYGSVERLADDLQAWLEHRPVLARRPSPLHRLRLLTRRHLAASAIGALGVVSALTLAGIAGAQYVQSQEERQRADVTRDFMFDFVDDSERDEQQVQAEPTGQDMVTAAISRARGRFATQPVLRGELLSELGRMQSRLGGAASSAAVQQEALALLTAHARPGDAALNKSRAYLADVHLAEGRLDQASGLARLALATCTRGVGCAKARFYASSILGRIALQRGDMQAALDGMRQGVEESRAGFGAQDAETALALLAYAITARQAGQLELARANLDQAAAMSRDLKLRLSDRLAVLRVGAVLDMDLGAYGEAGSRLREALASARRDGDRAQLWRFLATDLLFMGDPPAALEAADEALRLAPPQGVERLLAQQARARAVALLGGASAATDEMGEVIQGLEAVGYSKRAMEVMRARRVHAETRLRGGDIDAGLALLKDVAREQAEVMQGQEVEYALTLDLLGSALRSSGAWAAARQVHGQAAGLFESRLPVDHPYRLRNALYLQAAEASAHPTTQASQRLAELGERYASRFPAASCWRRAVEAALPGGPCGPAHDQACALFL